MNNDQQSFSTETLLVRRLTRGRKIVIGLWLVALTALIASTVGAFYAKDAGIEWFIDVSLRVFTNTQLGSQTIHFAIPIITSWRYIGFALSVWCGIKTLVALIFHPVVATRQISLPAHG